MGAFSHLWEKGHKGVTRLNYLAFLTVRFLAFLFTDFLAFLAGFFLAALAAAFSAALHFFNSLRIFFSSFTASLIFAEIVFVCALASFTCFIFIPLNVVENRKPFTN